MESLAMQLSILNLLHDHLRQIQFMASEVSEGVIILDGHDAIVWANAAALAMHRAEDLAALGHTIDDYHANFQIRFRSTRKPGVQGQSSDAPTTERSRDIQIEITPNGDTRP